MRIVDAEIRFTFFVDTDDGKGVYVVNDKLPDLLFGLPHVYEVGSEYAQPWHVTFNFDLGEFKESDIEASRTLLRTTIEEYEKKRERERTRRRKVGGAADG